MAHILISTLLLFLSGVLVVKCEACMNRQNYYGYSTGHICSAGCCYEYRDDPCCLSVDIVVPIVGGIIGSLVFVWLVLYVWAGALLKINFLRRLMLPELSAPVHPITSVERIITT